jgi:isoquinoline 1-oxidoreductase subunit alpha
MISCWINGTLFNLRDIPETPLLWVLRDSLGLTGTKYGCGKGLCGACNVLIEGNIVSSCSIPIASLSGNHIQTIEGIAQEKDHPVLRAWMETDVPQCGYCQPGQIVSATALLMKNTQPTDDEIDQAMAGNLCRCGTYPIIRRAIHRAALLLKSHPLPGTR